jgi:pyruvate ferredoxin oxidoreductase alpha subunit
MAVLDRSASFGGHGGPVFSEIRSALHGTGADFPVMGYIYGLGGREITLTQLASVTNDLALAAEGKADTERILYLGVRGEEMGR